MPKANAAKPKANPAWTLERNSRNVFTIKMAFDSAKWEQWILLRSDVHHDNPHCDQRLEKRHLDQAVERNAIIIDNGDLFCAMQGKYDKRSSKDAVRTEHQGSNYLDSLVSTAADFYRPYRNHLAILGRGNHETAIRKNHETDLTDRLTDALRSDGGITEASGYSGWIRFQIFAYKTERYCVTMHHYHGTGGGGPVTRGTIQTNRMAVYTPDADIILTGHCFSTDTEILTPTGWKNYESLVIGSPVATMNKDTNRLEFQPVSNVHKHTGYNRLLSIKADGLDLLVTEDHGLICHKRRSSKLIECKASEFLGMKSVTIPTAAEYEGEDLPYSDDDIRFAAWVVADGHIEPNAIRFHLKKQRKIDRLTALLHRMAADFTTGKESDKGTIKIRVGIGTAPAILARLGINGEDKTLPSWMYGLSGRQSQILLDEYRNTDGCGNGGDGMVLYSKERRNLDILQSCAVKVGMRSSRREGSSGADRLNIAKRSGVFFAEGRGEYVPHDGSVVWCVTVPNGTVIVRRNGCVAVTQNTHDEWQMTIPRQRLSNAGVVHRDEVTHIRPAGYKDAWNDAHAGWEVETGKGPKPIGAAWCRLSYDSTGHRIIREFTWAK